MQYRKMGSLDWKVSALGFGCMRLPSRRFSLMGADLEESKRIIRYGIDRGINYIDTAWPYHLGESEKVVGETLKDGYREKVKLVTKLPVPVVRKTEDFDRFLNSQLEKLQTDYLDIYLLHSLNAGTFEKVKRLGLIDKMEEAQRPHPDARVFPCPSADEENDLFQRMPGCRFSRQTTRGSCHRSGCGGPHNPQSCSSGRRARCRASDRPRSL